MKLSLFARIPPWETDSILESGFTDEHVAGWDKVGNGVLLLQSPENYMDFQENALLEVEFNATGIDLGQYEWIDEAAQFQRCAWLFPANLLNSRSSIRLIRVDRGTAPSPRRKTRRRKWSKAAILKGADAQCWYCGGRATERDHVIPLAKGGSCTDENMVPVCRACNLSKGSKTLEEFRVHWARRSLSSGCDKTFETLRRIIGLSDPSEDGSASELSRLLKAVRQLIIEETESIKFYGETNQQER